MTAERNDLLDVRRSLQAIIKALRAASYLDKPQGLEYYACVVEPRIFQN
jgi:hypothetical protein